MNTVRYALLLLLAMVLAPPSAYSAPSNTDIVEVNLEDTVIPEGATTYLGLARHFVTDLHLEDGTYRGATVKLPRTVDGSNDEEPYLDPAVISSARRIDLSYDGKRRMALLMDFGEDSQASQGLTVLALYDLDDDAHLLDAVNVGLDRFNGFAEPAFLQLSDGNILFLLQSSHFNSSQGYMDTTLILARRDRLETVTSYFTLRTNICAGVVDQLSSYKLLPARAKGALETIEVKVDVKAVESGEECSGETLGEKSRRIVVRFKWSKKLDRYVPSSHALDRLGDENIKKL